MLHSNKPPIPFLRWAGSKRKLIPALTKYWSGNNYRYIEPFMGSACLFFSLTPKKAILSDLNKDLVQLFISVRDDPKSVYESLILIPQGSESYYNIRAQDVESLEATAKAARFLFLNRFCFNGLYRTNKSGKFNVPFGDKAGTLPTLNQLTAASESLQEAEILVGDFADIIKNVVTSNDFVYLDPPYAVRNQRIFNQYGPDTFGLSDLDRLKNTLNIINDTGAHFLLSYACCDEAKEVFSQWNFKEISVQRNIAGFAKHRRRASELLFSNLDA